MAAYNLIATTTVGSGGAASIVFSGIPQTYTDLQIVWSVRSDYAGNGGFLVLPNGSTSNLSLRILYGSGAAAASYTDTSGEVGVAQGTTTTASVFTSGSMCIPNYTSSTYKSGSGDSVSENNAATAYQYLVAFLWSNTAAITSLTLKPGLGSFPQYSSASLYGIKNS